MQQLRWSRGSKSFGSHSPFSAIQLLVVAAAEETVAVDVVESADEATSGKLEGKPVKIAAGEADRVADVEDVDREEVAKVEELKNPTGDAEVMVVPLEVEASCTVVPLEGETLCGVVPVEDETLCIVVPADGETLGIVVSALCIVVPVDGNGLDAALGLADDVTAEDTALEREEFELAKIELGADKLDIAAGDELDLIAVDGEEADAEDELAMTGFDVNDERIDDEVKDVAERVVDGPTGEVVLVRDKEVVEMLEALIVDNRADVLELVPVPLVSSFKNVKPSPLAMPSTRLDRRPVVIEDRVVVALDKLVVVPVDEFKAEARLAEVEVLVMEELPTPDAEELLVIGAEELLTTGAEELPTTGAEELKAVTVNELEFIWTPIDDDASIELPLGRHLSIDASASEENPTSKEMLAMRHSYPGQQPGWNSMFVMGSMQRAFGATQEGVAVAAE